MSIEVSNAVWRHSKATGRTKLILLAIADHQGEQGAWPSISTLAKMTNSSERSVKRDIQDLQAMGELKVEVQKAPMSGKYKTNLYWVTLPDIDYGQGVTDRHPSDDGVTNQVSRGDKLGNLGVTHDGTQNLNRNLKETEGKNNSYKPSKQLVNELSEKYPGLDLKECWESMMDYCAANGKTYKDWDAGYRNWVRKEWQWSDKGKQQANQKDTRVYLDKSANHTQELLEEYAEAEKNSAPAPKCKHDKNLALCPICVKDL